jgi:GT2 family glycosyltransferase
VTAVILSYNSLETLTQVIDAVKKQTHPLSRVIVVDNGSNDGTLSYLQEQEQNLTLVCLSGNHGIGAGHNAGWRAALADANCDFIWSLEHDSIPEVDCLERLIETYINHPDKRSIGAIAPLDYSDYRSDDKLIYVWRKNRFIKVASLQSRPTLFFTKGFTFNGVLFPTDIIQAVGFLQADFFVGHEDTEYSRRMRDMGFQALNVPTATIYHNVLRSRQEISLLGRTFLIPNNDLLRSYYSTRNMIFLEKSRQNIPLLTLKILLKLPISLLYIILIKDQKLKRLLARLWAIKDGLSGNLGCKNYSFLAKHHSSSI